VRETCIQARRQHHVNVTELRHLEAFGEDADYAHRVIVHDEGFAQSPRVASERPLPEAIGKQSDCRGMRAIIFRIEIPAEEGGNAEGLEKIGCNGVTIDAARRVTDHRITTHAGPHGGERFEWPLLPIEVTAHDVELIVINRPQIPHGNKLIVLRVGQPAKQKGIDHAEHRRRGADAKRQRHNYNRREARILPQHPERIANVLPEVFEPGKGPQFPAGLLKRSAVTKAPSTCVAGLFRIQAPCPQLFFAHREVEAHLVFQVAIQLAPLEERLGPEPDAG
jgi:hypothetical protein